MSGELHQAGARFLRLLGREATAIMDVYQSGSVPESDACQALLQQGVLYRPEAGAGLRLRPAVRTLLEDALKDERNRAIDANVGGFLARGTTFVGHYKEARHRGDLTGADAHLSHLSELVYGFIENLRRDVRAIWSKINNEFGYASTISAKIRENELAQSQISKLLDGLQLVDFAELAGLVGDERELRRLMIGSLQSALAECMQELWRVQSRLLDLLGRFRHIRGTNLLLKGWALHAEINPDYRVANHGEARDIARLVNLANAVLEPACADIDASPYEATLFEIAAEISAQRRSSAASPPSGASKAEPIRISGSELIDSPADPLRESVKAYFCAVIEIGGTHSALEYLAENDLQWDAEVWLHQVIGCLEQLPNDQRHAFKPLLEGNEHPIYSGNYIVRDVSLCLA